MTNHKKLCHECTKQLILTHPRVLHKKELIGTFSRCENYVDRVCSNTWAAFIVTFEPEYVMWEANIGSSISTPPPGYRFDGVDLVK